jgi:hypothetical protein
MISTFKSAVVGSVLATGLAFSGAASAGITLDTSGLKADATLKFSAPATSLSGLTGISFGALGNTVYQGTSAETVDGNTVQVPSFGMPVTKATISIGWDLKITANSGESSRSALAIKLGAKQVVLANFAIDFDKKIVYADAIIDGVTSKKTAIYTFKETVPQAISFKNLVLNQSVTLGELIFTPAAATQIGNALALPAPLQTVLSQLDYGTIKVLVTSYKRSPKANATPFTAADIPK